MANNATFTIKLEVDASGNLKLAENQVKKLGKAVKETGNAQAEANKKAEDAYSTQNKGVIGTANSTKSFSKLTQTIGNGSNGLVGAYAALAANAFAVSAAFSALNNAAQATALLQGLEAQGARAGKTLTILSARLREITKNSISSTEAMRATAQATTSGISGADLERLTAVATDASLALGRDVPDSLNRMVLAVTKMEPELVDELGLTTKITEASEKYARQNGITVSSMTQMQKQQALLNAWVEQGTAKFGGLADEVDPNPYNQLAATFDNLVKSGLNIVNVLLKPLVSFLASSEMILLGVGTMFIGTIRGQIIPGLQDTAKEALKAAETNRTAAIKQVEDQKLLGAGKRKSINEFIAASKDGMATQEQFNKALQESKDRVTAAEKQDRLHAATKQRIARDEETRQKNLESIHKAQTNVLKEEARAQAYSASEGVNLTNAKSKLKGTLQAIANSFTVNYNAMKTTEKGYRSLGTNALAAGTAMKAAGKAAVIGFINFIPVIGQVIALVSILWEFVGRPIFEKLTGRTEEVKKALEDFNTVVDNTSKKVEALAKINSSSASASERAIEAIVNQTSTMYELADAYIAVYEANKKTETDDSEIKRNTDKRLELQRQLTEAVKAGDSAAIQSIQNQQQLMNKALKLGVSADTQAAQAFANEAGQIWTSDKAEAAAQYLDNLEKQMPRVAQAFYDAQGGARAFNNLEEDEKLRLVAEQAKTSAQSLKNLESAFRSLNSAVKDVNTGYVDFLRSITPTTPYDTILDKFQGLDKSIRQAQKAISNGGAGIGTSADEANKRLSESLAGFSGQSRNIFTLDVQADLSTFDVLDERLQGLVARQAGLQEGQDEYKAVTAEIARVETERSDLLTRLTPVIMEQERAYRNKLVEAQRESIVLQGNLAIAQAHLSVIQKQGIVTGEDVARQMKAENAVLAIQAQQILTQKTFLDIDLQKERNRLKELEDQLRILKVYKEMTTERQRGSIQSRLTEIDTQLGASTTDEKTRTALQRERTALRAAETDINTAYAETEREIEDRKIAINREEAQSVALGKQAVAILMQGNSALSIRVARSIKNLENERESLAIQRETLSIRDSIVKTEADALSLITMSNDGIAKELDSIRRAADLKRTSLYEEWDIRKQILNLEIVRARGNNNASQVAYYTNLLTIEEARYNASNDLIDSEERYQVLAQAAFKSEEDLVNKKREALDVQIQILDATVNSMKAIQDYRRAALDLELKRKGISDTPAAQYQRQVQAARDAYELASQEIVGKIALIQLEFALLKAKRATLASELSQRQNVLSDERDSLAAQLEAARAREAAQAIARSEQMVTPAPTAPANDNSATNNDQNSIVVTAAANPSADELARRLAGIDAQIAAIEYASDAISNVSNDTIDRTANTAIESLQLGLETLKKNLEIAIEKGLKNPEGLLSMSNEIALLGKQAKEGTITKTEFVTQGLESYINKVKDSLAALGPEGEIVLAIAQTATNISNSFQDTFEVLGDAAATSGEKVAAVASAVSAVIGGVMSILNATSKAKIANIDKEIAAEEKRDGKSKESVARLDALEKKKDSIARKAFNTNKKLMMAQAVMSTAAGVAGALAHTAELGPAAFVLAGLIGAMGLAQLAIISGTQYESSYTPRSIETPSTLSIGKRDNSVNLAMGPNANAGGEVGYIRGAAGTGSSASNYSTIGSAYGGQLNRGYGRAGYVVGEKGPEIMTPETPITVTPANENTASNPVNATINIQAIDSQGVQDVLVAQKGNIIQMLRQAANANGQRFLEDVNVNVYTRPSVGKLL